MGLLIPIRPGKWIEIIRQYRKDQKYRIYIENVHLSKPTLVQSDDGQTFEGKQLAMRYNLSFRIVNKGNIPLDACSYAIVFESSSTDETSNTVTQNYTGNLDYDGLSEPQIAPLQVATDLDDFVRVVDDDREFIVSRNPSEEIIMRIRLGTSDEEISGDMYETTVQSLIQNWIRDCYGMDFRSFADSTDADLQENLEQIPETRIGPDLYL